MSGSCASDGGLDHARAVLREEQRAGRPAEQGSTTAEALRHHAERTRCTDDARPDLVRRGPFRFERALEHERIARGRAVILRSAPGPHEDPGHLALLAHEAASVEMVFDDLAPGAALPFERFVLGTAPSPDVNASAQRIGVDGHVVVVVNGALVDFVFQAARAVVEALDPRSTAAGGRQVAASGDRDLLRRRVAQDPRAERRLHRTLAAVFFEGRPLGSRGEVVPVEHAPALALLAGLAARWVVAHEYGHGLGPAPDEHPWAEELAADATATITCVASAAKLDGVGPEVALGAAVFVVRCLGLLTRGLAIVLTGDEHGLPEASETHPAPSLRERRLLEAFRRAFAYDHEGAGLTLHLDDRGPRGPNRIDERLDGVRLHGDALDAVWPAVARRLHDDLRRRTPHPMWH